MKILNEIWNGFTQLLGTWTITILVVASIFIYNGLLKVDCNTHGMCTAYLK